MTFLVQSLGAVVGGLLNYVIMRVIITAQREVLLDVQGTNVWSGQQVQVSMKKNSLSLHNGVSLFNSLSMLKLFLGALWEIFCTHLQGAMVYGLLSSSLNGLLKVL